MKLTRSSSRILHRGRRWLAIVAAVLSGSAFAQIAPSDWHENVSLTFDRSALPSDWRFRPPLTAHYEPGSQQASRTFYLCRSASDSSLGACPTVPEFHAGPTVTPVSLRFVEERSKLQVNLNVGAVRLLNRIGGNCGYLRLPFNSYRSGTCQGPPLDASFYELSLARTELQKIPVGGIWRARFEFDVMEHPPTQPSAVHSYDIELRVTDENNAQIYFPALDNASPRVALDLHSRPGPGGTLPIVSGGKSVDLCFYDGFGSNSPGALRLRVSQPRGPLPGQPAGQGGIVLFGTPGTSSAHRIDYRVTFDYNGRRHRLMVDDGVGSAFTPVAQTGIRMVHLPGIPLPVACSPAALRFDVVPFHITSKRAGVYEGQLKLEMFADAAAF